MNQLLLFVSCLLLSFSLSAQLLRKPVGCFAGTNGTNPEAMAHPDSRGVLLIEKWSDLEVTPGNFDFSELDDKISRVTAANLKYALAIAAGAFGSPDWLIDEQGAGYLSFQYQAQNWRLPLWWDETVEERFDLLIGEIGSRYAQDTSLSHVYVTQMTVNGVEGHLNGVNMNSFAASGYTDEKWINSAKATTGKFAEAFPNHPIVFEIHEIGQGTLVPATIVNELNETPELCGRFGLAMWWISGKDSYQTDLIDYIKDFQGDKYAQVIGRSDQTYRFQDSLYSTVFTQARELGIRYLEPWPYEFQHHTHDSLLHDFNTWADANFSEEGGCNSLPVSWLSFSATPREKSVELTWETATEENNERFRIERSTNGRTWQVIGQEPAATGGGQYTFEDESPHAGRNYYRIRQEDLDERFAYSVVRHVDFQRSGNMVWPNPATKQITVFSIIPDEVTLHGLRGQSLLNFSHPGSAHRLSIDLAPGVYAVHFRQQNQVLKLVVR